ncbi:MAG: hypothetical protein PHE17_14965 [Thiothrix sp.]|uniref:hypothetical protein n=1 Tax=Thiothrix sp. TaxID=1032 RepID=UPI002628EA88|nr:hypothetical protein [Thiothrix sp.]MDD5394313.1 hypothetical protein [Thiothrix sp.]
MAEYLIEYSGMCWIEENTTYTGDIPGLLREVDWIEGRGGRSVTVTDQETGETVYEDGGLTPYLAHADEVASLSIAEWGGLVGLPKP